MYSDWRGRIFRVLNRSLQEFLFLELIIILIAFLFFEVWKHLYCKKNYTVIHNWVKVGIVVHHQCLLSHKWFYSTKAYHAVIGSHVCNWMLQKLPISFTLSAFLAFPLSACYSMSTIRLTYMKCGMGFDWNLLACCSFG